MTRTLKGRTPLSLKAGDVWRRARTFAHEAGVWHRVAGDVTRARAPISGERSYLVTCDLHLGCRHRLYRDNRLEIRR